VEDCSQIKTGRLPIYTGDEDGSVTCLAWLNKIISAAQTARLSYTATVKLMVDRSDGKANSKIRQCQRDNMSLYQIISKLELVFAKVQPPAEARVQVNNMIPHDREDLGAFAIRLRDIAQIAARDVKDDAERHITEMRMCKTNYMRILPVHLYNYVIQKEADLASVGKPAMEFEAISSLIEGYVNTQRTKQSREKTEKRRQLAEAQEGRTGQRVNQIFQEMDDPCEENDPGQADPDPDHEGMHEHHAESIHLISPEDLEDDNYSREDVINIVRQQAPRGRYPSRGGPARGRDYQYPRPNRPERIRPTFERPERAYELDEYKLPGLLKDRKPDFPSNRLPQLANIDNEPNRCFKCGLATTPPHRQADYSCPLYGLPLTDRACLVCGKGLHFAKQCPLAFQTGHKHLADRQIAAKND
jgi:hypothetical protein